MGANLDITKTRKIYTGLPKRILTLMCAGCTPIAAAQQVGCDPSYVNHLCKEEDFQSAIDEACKKGLEEAVQIDSNYREVEKTLSDRLKSLAGMMISPDQVLRALKVVNGLNKHVPAQAMNGQEQNSPKPVAQLVLPRIVINNFIVNPNNEVISVDGRNLVTLNSSSIDSLVKRTQEIDVIEMERSPPNLQVEYNGKSKRKPASDDWENL